MNNEEKILAMLQQMQSEMSDIKQNMATKQEMKEGFARLENLINVAAQDAAKTERRLREHIESHIA